MLRMLQALLSPSVERADLAPSTRPMETSSPERRQDIRSLGSPRNTSRQAPLTKGLRETSSYIAGDSSALANLNAVQAAAHEQAKQRASPVPARKPYSIQPGGHVETIRWVSMPDSPPALERLLAVRDVAASRRNARDLQSFNPRRISPEPEMRYEVPRLPRFRSRDDGFVSLTRLVAEEIELTVPEASEVDHPSRWDTQTSLENHEFPNDEDIRTESIRAEDDPIDTNEEDRSSTASRWSYSSSSSSGSYYSDDEEESLSRLHRAEQRPLERAREVVISPRRWIGPSDYNDQAGSSESGARTHGSTEEANHIEPWTEAWEEAVRLPSHYSLSNSPVTDEPQHPLRKYHYTTTPAARRLDYIKSYLSLRDDMRPIDLILYILEWYQTVACAAARKNPALLRAAEEIDWDGIIDELPLPRHRNDEERISDRDIVEKWLDWGARLFLELDKHGNPVFVQADEESKELSWEELLMEEDLRGPKNRRYDTHFRRANWLSERKHDPSATRSRRQNLERTKLGWTLSAP